MTLKLTVLILTFALVLSGCVLPETKYPIHKNITVTNFWVGEAASEDNHQIPNAMSAWDEQWLENYGGIDSPENRLGVYPAGFIPKENPFYFALPYNDLDENGVRKANAVAIYWAPTTVAREDESILKNRWIRITHDKKTTFAQWEDVGAFEEDDVTYVFGSDRPKTPFNDNVGLDVSPAVKDYLGLEDIDKVEWQFVDEQNVPDGIWKKTVTTRK